MADKLDGGRLDGLEFIGADEVSYGADHKFLTRVADHVAGRVVWPPRAATPPACRRSSTGSPTSRKHRSRRSRSNMSAGDEKAITEAVPHAQVVFDPFHVIQLSSKATDQVRRAEYNKHGRSDTESGKWITGVRYSLLKHPAKQTTHQLLRLCEEQQTNKAMFRAALLHGELRYLYKTPQNEAPERPDA